MTRVPPPLIAVAAAVAQRALTGASPRPTAGRAAAAAGVALASISIAGAKAIRRGSWADLLPVAGFVLVIDRFQIRAEEEALLEKFGAEYDAYRASSPKWIGRRSRPVAA